jgi:predicted DNA-binding transcriptional regulator AlpA
MCEPVGVAEIAERLSVKRGTVDAWRKRHSSFPQPRWAVSRQACWEWADVDSWIKETGRVSTTFK